MNTVKRTRGDKEDMFDDYSGGVEDLLLILAMLFSTLTIMPF